ncbi:MAG: DUF6318 family protein [Propionibacteriales bacterium]|nr:DUF6318 family protein [Propionibacteriales bacterium]
MIEPSPTVGSPTSTPSAPSSTAPPLPSEASAATSTGAATFTRYWIDLFNFAAMSGETAELRRFSEGCEPCIAYAQDFEQLPREQRPKAAPWTVTEMSVARSGRKFIVAAEVKVLGESETRTLNFQIRKLDPFVVHDLKELR